MAIDTLQDLYIHELKDIYSAEKQILHALPQMAKGASHAELRQAFEEHHRVTEEQVRRLDTIFDELGQKPQGEKCKSAWKA
jgi:ferritin-like metal-binding protein YciE